VIILYREALDIVKSNYNMRLGAKKNIEANIAKSNEEKEKLKALSESCNKVLELLNLVSAQAREKAKGHLENIVTEALKFISGGEYEFKIEMLERGKPSCDFYVESVINGLKSKQKPEEACGGGFVDIIATTLRYAYLEIFSDPVIKNSMIILDEPGKMISEEASVRFAKFVKSLGDNFNKQTIMVTHKDNLLKIADKAYYVSQINKVSNVISNSATDVDLDNIDLSEVEI
jgi:DNA repair ATPase RecN